MNTDTSEPNDWPAEGSSYLDTHPVLALFGGSGSLKQYVPPERRPLETQRATPGTTHTDIHTLRGNCMGTNQDTAIGS
jgi:hypothetical protein